MALFKAFRGGGAGGRPDVPRALARFQQRASRR